MKPRTLTLIIFFVAAVAGGLAAGMTIYLNDSPTGEQAIDPENPILLANNVISGDEPEVPVTANKALGDDLSLPTLKDNESPLPGFMKNSLEWLAKAQFSNGGFGAGTHANQGVSDPHAVQVDPATTAFVATAFVRSGSTHKTGQYANEVSKSMNWLLKHVESLPSDATSFTSVTGTQPQRKLGQNIDATFTSQFFTRMLDLTDEEPELHQRLENGVAVCVRLIENTQNNDGSFAGGSWAGVLQSSMANSALEQAEVNGVKVNSKKLKASRSYQRSNFDVSTGAAKTEAAAGVSLYAISSTNRATARNARRAQRVMEKAKEEGKVDQNAEIDLDNLQQAGLEEEDAEAVIADFKANEMTTKQLQKDDVLSGFGNNGGEEFLSFMMTSESLVITGGDAWEDWNKRMNKTLSKIQNNDGSWSGHHCITSPVFCTAAAIMTLTTDRDVEYLASQEKN